MGFPVGSEVKNPPVMPDMEEMQIRFLGSTTSPGGRHDNPLQYSCLENPMDSRTWWATVHGVTKKLDVTKHTSLVAQLVKNLPAMDETPV